MPHYRCPVAARLFTLTVVLAAACSRAEYWSEGLTAQRTALLQSWFFCDECERGERAAVAALGNNAVVPLDRVLLQLPEDWRKNLLSRYGTAARQAYLTGADSVAYVKRFLDNFQATTQGRAATVLGDIRTPAAVTALERALADTGLRGYRSDVVQDIRRAHLKATTQPLQGEFSPKVVRFLDTVWVTRTGGVAWDRDENVSLIGGPFPDDVAVGYRAADKELGFLAAALPGVQAFSIGNVGAGADIQHGEFRISSFPAAPSTLVPQLVQTSFPRTFLLSLTRTTSPPDPVHFIRIQAGTRAVRLTVRTEWTGPARIDRVWDDCAARGTGAATPGKISGHVFDFAGNSLGGGAITLRGTSVGAVAAASGDFEISPVPAGWIGNLVANHVGFAPQELIAWEGARDLKFVLTQALPPTPAASMLPTSTSPASDALIVPVGSCRLLSVVRRDVSNAPAIVRLRLTSP